MNYERNYYDYINYVKSLGKRELEYFEVHHILPRCLGGSDEPDNLVVLTAREHFLAYYLLIKIYPENFKLIDAFRMMGVINEDEQKRYINSRLYESKRKLFALARGMKVRCVETGEEFNSITEAERKYGCGVGEVVRGRQLTAGGYHWERVDGKTIIKQPFQRKKVICANIGEVFDNFELAADFADVNPSLIRSLCNGRRKGTAKGYTFYYYEGDDKEYPILKFEPKTRKVRCIETGEVFNSIKEAAKGDKSEAINICSCCKGKQVSHKGLHWQYAEEEPKQLSDFKNKQLRGVRCVETGKEYESVIEAARENGIFSTNIIGSCNSINRKAGGYHWQYVEDTNTVFVDNVRKSKVRCVETGEEFDSIKEAAKGDIQLAKRISQGCREGGSVFGFHWEYTENKENKENKERISSKRKKVRCVETGKIYKSISEAANWKHSLRSKIAACCCGELEEANGFHWEYTNEEAA